MDQLAIITPSYMRPVELARLDLSLEENTRVSLLVQKEFVEPRSLVELLNEMTEEAFQIGASHVAYLSDLCVVTEENFDTRLMDVFKQSGADFVDLPIRNQPNAKAGCFWAVTKKFWLDLECTIQCPDYYHFYADTETAMYAQESGRYAVASNLGVELHHVNTGLAKPDQTHSASRSHKKWDDEVWRERQAREFLWGRSFRLVRKGDKPWHS